MEALLQERIIRAVSEGDFIGAMAWIATFVMLWLQLKGIRKEAKEMNTHFKESLAAGEKRFENLEDKNILFEHRITMLEQKKT